MLKISHVLITGLMLLNITSAFASYNNKETGFYLKHFATMSDLKDTSCKQFLKTVNRGGQPVFDGTDAWLKRLKLAKVKTVFDLRSETRNAVKERDILLKNGIGYVKMPLKTSGRSQDLSMMIEVAIPSSDGLSSPVITKTVMPTLEATAYVLSLMEETISKQNPEETIYLHCQRGEDRTGLMIALLRQCAGTGYKKEFLSYGGVMYKPLQKLFDDMKKRK
jgi:hypothetical protein